MQSKSTVIGSPNSLCKSKENGSLGLRRIKYVNKDNVYPKDNVHPKSPLHPPPHLSKFLWTKKTSLLEDTLISLYAKSNLTLTSYY